MKVRIFAERGPLRKKVSKNVKKRLRCTKMAIAEALELKKQQVNDPGDALLEYGILNVFQGGLIFFPT